MVHPKNWITVLPQGLFCIPGNFFIDPLRPVDMALITHGHADHARFGHTKVLTTPETSMIMKIRYPDDRASHQIITYGETININGVRVSFYSAGHITGSAQILLEYQGGRLIISGDYKRRYDPTCPLFTVQPCDVFITEATFGLPVFVHPPIEQELVKLQQSLMMFPQSCHLVGAYALGKCQRIILALRQLGYDRPIYLHGAMQKLCDLYRSWNFDLGELFPVSVGNAKNLAGQIVLCPPSALHSHWTRKFPNVIHCYASGWMQVRARAKQKGIELPLIISDHADWQELTKTLHEVNAPEVWITHGNEEALIHYARQHGFKAKALALLHAIEEEE